MNRSTTVAASLMLALGACWQETQPQAENKEEVRPAAEPERGARDQVPGRAARITSIGAEDCRTVEESLDELPFWRRDCPGAGGFRMQTTESDGRSNLFVVDPSGNRTSLDVPGTIGAGFGKLGRWIEWRGAASDPFRPDSLIFRYDVAEDPHRPMQSTAYLGVARLTGGGPCIVARLEDGSGWIEEARQIADAPGPATCLGT